MTAAAQTRLSTPSSPRGAMRLIRFFLAMCLVPAVVALAGAALGAPFGRQGLYLVAIVAGTFGVMLAVHLLVRVGWLRGDRTRGATIGALVGLGLGAPLAAMGIDQPLMVLTGSLLIGVGALVGTGRGAVP